MIRETSVMIADNAYEKFGQQIALLKIFCEDFAFKKVREN
jgi:hypothetical protein